MNVVVKIFLSLTVSAVSFSCFDACCSKACLPEAETVKVDVSHPMQVIEHFGASDAWAGQFVGEHWADSVKSQIADWLFSNEFDKDGNPCGIGLSLWRANVGAGSLERKEADIIPFANRAQSYLAATHFEDMSSDRPFEYDWNKCRGLEYFASRGQQLGCSDILLFSNSPLVQLTLNGKGHSDFRDKANIKPEGFSRYADYLAEVTSHLRGKGLNVSYVSPINEPSVDWVRNSQEGSSWTRSEYVKMVRSLDSAFCLRPELADVKIYVSEAASVKEAYCPTDDVAKPFRDREDRPDNMIPSLFASWSPYYIGNLSHVEPVLGLHEYHSNRSFKETIDTRTRLGECCRQMGVGFHMSEWCLLGMYANGIEGFPEHIDEDLGDINVALLIGRMMYADFKLAGCSSWSYWKAMDNRRGPLIRLHSEGENILVSGTAAPQKIMWAIGNYSRFVRPGYRFVGSEGADDIASICSSSFISPDGKRLVSVFVNTSYEDTPVRLEATGFCGAAGRAHCYLTSSECNLSLQKGMIDIRRGVTVPARSLLTVVLDR